MIIDPIGDLLTRIRNGQMRRMAKIAFAQLAPAHRACSMCCRQKASSAAMPRSNSRASKELEIELKYHEGEPVIRELKRVSTPGRRVYASVRSLKPHRQGLGVSIFPRRRA